MGALEVMGRAAAESERKVSNNLADAFERKNQK